MRDVRRMRLRNGSVAWGLFQDMSEPGRYIEYCIDPSGRERVPLEPGRYRALLSRGGAVLDDRPVEIGLVGSEVVLTAPPIDRPEWRKRGSFCARIACGLHSGAL